MKTYITGVISIFTTHKVYRFLFLIPVAIMIAFSLFFSDLSKEIEKNLLAEKFAEKKLDVAMMANHADAFIAKDNDWGEEHAYYQQSLVFDMEALDKQNQTYAAVFDSNLTQLSRQDFYNGGFNPMIYPSFIEAVRANGMGDMAFHYVPEGTAANGPARDVFVHYRWIPTGAYQDKFLVVVAISKLTIITKMAGWTNTGIAALITITAICNLAMVAVITWMRQAIKKLDQERKNCSLGLCKLLSK